MPKKFRISSLCLAATMTLASTNAYAVDVSLKALPGVLGTPTAGTQVFKGDLGAIAGNPTITQIAITDASGGKGGSPGRFSGFDLDAIILSTKNCANVACLVGAPVINVFNYASGTVFTKGTQRTPLSVGFPNLFGTDATGNALNNSVATLQSFDANSDTGNPLRFISLGDSGSILFNLTSPTSLAGLYLYIGEVGGNGETAGAKVELFGASVGVPEPSTWAMMILGLGFAGAAMRRRRQQVSVTYA